MFFSYVLSWFQSACYLLDLIIIFFLFLSIKKKVQYLNLTPR